jgi:hypothetical protein
MLFVFGIFDIPEIVHSPFKDFDSIAELEFLGRCVGAFQAIMDGLESCREISKSPENIRGLI